MTEEKSCRTCRLSSSNNVTIKLCQYLGETCNDYNYFSKWQPIAQEKPMENKVIFESEEECAEFLCNVYNHNKEYCLRSLVPMAKQKGYIRKSELVELVEEAEWIYENYQSAKYCLTTSEALEKNYQALQALKKDHPEFGGKK
jgi:hypothetical protein